MEIWVPEGSREFQELGMEIWARQPQEQLA
jgi:hypothetical protein